MNKTSIEITIDDTEKAPTFDDLDIYNFFIFKKDLYIKVAMQGAVKFGDDVTDSFDVRNDIIIPKAISLKVRL